MESELKDSFVSVPDSFYEALKIQQDKKWSAYSDGRISVKIDSVDRNTENKPVEERLLLAAEDNDGKTGIKNVELAQLLVNSLANSKNDFFSYNNITGKLYYPFKRKNKKVLEFLRIRFFAPNSENENVLGLEAETETFSEVESLRKYGKKTREKTLFLTRKPEISEKA